MILLGTLKAALKLDPDDTSEDEYLESVEAAAVAYLERATGRYFGRLEERTEYLTGTGAQEVWLAEPPAGDVTVTSDGTAVAADDFTVRGRRLRHASGWWGSPRWSTDLVVTYTAGYPAGLEPADIRHAVTKLASFWFEQRVPVDGEPDTIPADVQRVIDAHRRLVA
jgi:uncharacterized phiE125 gp8 family phage protein